MTLRTFPVDIARAIGFLSRIPMPGAVFEGYDGKLDRVSAAFALAGLVIAAPPALLFGLLAAFHADPLLSAILTLALQTILTGALHEDGLSDTADGLGGGSDRERALSIMKDSRIGTYGAIALILGFALRTAALSAIAKGAPPLSTGLAVLATAALSRAALVWHWHVLPPAKPDGVAAAAGKPDAAALRINLICGLAVAVLLLWPAFSLGPSITALLAIAIVTFACTRWIGSRLGGHTGDTLGATQQVAEIAALCALALAV